MRLRRFVFVLALVFAFNFTFANMEASAKTKTTSSKSGSRKISVKSSSTKKTTRKTSSKSKTNRISARRGAAYSRGSGAVLGEGDVARLVNYAKKLQGVKYVYGASSAKGFDCSGFTMYVYKAAGISLPHSATEQSAKGLAVSKENLKPGDLVFFETGGAGISHVGIYIGSGKFIHASSGAGHVTITNLSEKYYAARYRGATRILN